MDAIILATERLSLQFIGLVFAIVFAIKLYLCDRTLSLQSNFIFAIELYLCD